MKYLTVISLLLFYIPVSGQDTVKEHRVLSGKAYDKHNQRNIPYAHIINRSTISGTISDSAGVFRIHAEPGDTLFVSAMGYQFDIVTIDSVKNDTSFKVFLVPRAYMLPEVVIYELDTYEKFQKRFATVQVEDDRYHVPGLPHLKPGGVPLLRDTNYIRSPIFALNSPVSFLYYNLSRKERNKRKYYQILQKDQKAQQARQRYTDDLLIEITGINEEEIDEFLRFCDFDPQYIIKISDYELYGVIKQCYRRFRVSKINQ